MAVEAGAQDMPEFLTGEWVSWLDAALSTCAVRPDLSFVLEHRVSRDDGSVFSWHVRVASGRVSARIGLTGEEPGQALVRFHSDSATARAIAVGGGSAQRAFAEGRLHLDGDPRLLIAARPALKAIGAALTG